MFTVEFEEGTYDAEVTFYTAVLYEQEFCKDMLQDFFGVQGADGPIGVDGDSIVTIDFTKVNWAASTKVLWAALKTADPSIPSYTAWVKNAKGANLWLVREQLAEEIGDCFFRSEVAGEETEEKEER